MTSLWSVGIAAMLVSAVALSPQSDAPETAFRHVAQARLAGTPIALGSCAEGGNTTGGATPAPPADAGPPQSGPTPTPLPLANAVHGAAIASAVTGLLSCWRVNDSAAIAALSSASDPSDLPPIPPWLAQARAASETSLAEISNVRGNTDSRASADVHWRQGNLERHERWSFDNARAGAGSRLRLLIIQPLAPGGRDSAVGIPVTITATAISASRTEIVSPGRIVMHLSNDSGEACTFALMRLSNQSGGVHGATPTSTQVQESAYAGSAALAPDETIDLVFVELPPGHYALVALGSRQLTSALTIAPA